MKKSNFTGPSPTHSEITAGALYFLFQLLVLPTLLTWANRHSGVSVTDAELNFLYYLINFLAVLVIFRGFLAKSVSQGLHHPAYLCQAVILGLAAYYACTWVAEYLAARFVPGFTNYNDASISALGRQSLFLTGVGTVLLVPTAEECFYRGLIFGGLYGKSRWGAYLASMLAFAAVHILGYLGSYSAWELLVALAQYLPAGLCLAWSYTKADTILAPIAIHTVINFFAIQALR